MTTPLSASAPLPSVRRADDRVPDPSEAPRRSARVALGADRVDVPAASAHLAIGHRDDLGARGVAAALLHLPAPPRTAAERTEWAEQLSGLRADPELLLELPADQATEVVAHLVAGFHSLDDDPPMAIGVAFTLTALMDFQRAGPELAAAFAGWTVPDGRSLLELTETVFTAFDAALIGPEGPRPSPEAIRAWVDEQVARALTGAYPGPRDAEGRAAFAEMLARPDVPLTTFQEMYRHAVETSRMIAPEGAAPSPASSEAAPPRSGAAAGAGLPAVLVELLSRVETARQEVIDDIELQVGATGDEVSQAWLAQKQAELATFDAKISVLQGLVSTEVDRIRRAAEAFERGVSR